MSDYMKNNKPNKINIFYFLHEIIKKNYLIKIDI